MVVQLTDMRHLHRQNLLHETTKYLLRAFQTSEEGDIYIYVNFCPKKIFQNISNISRY